MSTSNPSWEKFVADYLEHALIYRRERGVDAYARVLRRLMTFSKRQPLSPDLISDYLLTRRGLAPTTIASEWSVFSSFNAWLRRRGLVGEDLMRLTDRPRVPIGDPIEAPKATVARVAAWLDDEVNPGRSRRFVALCLYAGLRFDEARLTTWLSVDLGGRELRVRTAIGKGGRGRRIPLAPMLEDILSAVPEAERVGAIAGMPDGKPLSRGGAVHIFDRELARAGILISPHMLRRAFTTRLDELWSQPRDHPAPLGPQLPGHDPALYRR